MQFILIILSFLLISIELHSAEPNCIDQLVLFAENFNCSLLEKGAKSKSWDEDNRYGLPGEKLHYVELFSGEGRYITVECPSCNPPKAILELELMVSNFEIPCNITMGLSQKKIEELIGRPQEKDPNELLYIKTGVSGWEWRIKLKFAKDKLESIQWEYLYD
jgi:hypothetical protein